MATDDNYRNPGEKAGDASMDSGEDTSGKAIASAQPLLAGVSRFAQQAQRNQESLAALLRQVGGQLGKIDAKAEQSNAQIEKLGNWIRNNRR